MSEQASSTDATKQIASKSKNITGHDNTGKSTNGPKNVDDKTESQPVSAGTKKQNKNKNKTKNKNKNKNKNDIQKKGHEIIDLDASLPQTEKQETKSKEEIEAEKKMKKKARRKQKKQKRRQESKTESHIKPSRLKLRLKPKEPIFKLTVRKLPPNLCQESFINKVVDFFPDFNDLVRNWYYCPGQYPDSQFEQSTLSRCYINCKSKDAMMAIGRAIKELTFVDDDKEPAVQEEGNTDVQDRPVEEKEYDNDEIYGEADEREVYKPVIEKSMYQEMPNLTKDNSVHVEQWDFFNGKLGEIAIYQRFCEAISEEGRTQLPADIFEYQTQYEKKKLAEKREAKLAAKKQAKKLAKKKKALKLKESEKKVPSEEKEKKKPEAGQKKKKKKSKADKNHKEHGDNAPASSTKSNNNKLVSTPAKGG